MCVVTDAVSVFAAPIEFGTHFSSRPLVVYTRDLGM